MRAWTAAILLAVLCLTSAWLRAGDALSGAGAFAAEAVATAIHDGDPPDEAVHRASHAKKPRLTSLQICTLPASLTCEPPAFHLANAGDRTRVARVRPRVDLDTLPVHRIDPALRLHPGQAPPRAT